MATIAQIPWNTGSGEIIISSVQGKPNTFEISSTTNDEIEREQELTFTTTNSKGDKASTKLIVKQKGLRELFITADNQVFVTSDNENFTVLKE